MAGFFRCRSEWPGRRLGSMARAAGLFVLGVLVGGWIVAAAAGAAAASCLPVAGLPQPFVTLASLRGAGAPPPASFAVRAVQAAPSGRGPKLPDGMVEITYLGHSSFLIRTPANVAAITDYNGYNRAAFVPDIVTMNHAHSSHYTDDIDPGILYVLRGWDDLGGRPYIDVRLRDMRVRNVSTNIRNGAGGTEFAGNSIFVFETAGLCIAHVDHLHHLLTSEQLGRIGEVDILMVPIDDGLTMPQARVADVVASLKPAVVMPMHYFGDRQVQRFLDLMRGQGYVGRFAKGPVVRFTKRTLPRKTILVLAGGM